MTVEGYRIKEKSGRLDSAILCRECSSQLPIDASKDAIVDLSTSNYGTFYCTVCEKDVTRGGGKKDMNYPEEIATLFKRMFEDRGPRFGGVNPIIDSAGREEEQITEGVKKVESVRTQHDPVIIEVRDKSLANDLNKAIEKMSQIGRIRGQMTEITDEGGTTVVYEFELFAV